MSNNIMDSHLIVWVDNELKGFPLYSSVRSSIFKLGNLSERYYFVRLGHKKKIFECGTIGSDTGDSHSLEYMELPETLRTQLLLLGFENGN